MLVEVFRRMHQGLFLPLAIHQEGQSLLYIIELCVNYTRAWMIACQINGGALLVSSILAVLYYVRMLQEATVQKKKS